MSDETVITTPPPPTPPAPPQAAPPQSSSPPPAPPPRKRRWFLRLFVLLVVLLLIGGGLLLAVQWALQNTDYAREIALPIVEQQLGLRLHAKGLKVSLLGHTELTDVDVGLPLDKADFLHVPAIRVKHANLLGIILARAVTLDDVTIDKPTVDVVQDANGQWNLLQVVGILGRLGGSNNAQPTPTSGGVPKLPAVHLIDGTINLADNGKHRVKIYPLNVSGNPQDQLVWKYDLAAGPTGAEFLKVAGVVAPGGSWTHEVTAAVGHLDPLAQAFGVPSTYGAAINLTWDGGLSDGKVGGKLKLQQVSAFGVPSLGNVGVTGSLDVTTGGSAPAAPAGANAAVVAGSGLAPLVTLTPSNLLVQTSNPTVPTLGVATGNITYDAAGLHTRGLKVNVLGGAASIDASADPKTQNVDLTAHWTGLTLAADISQAGTLTASVRQPFPGQPLIRVELDDRGSIGATTASAGQAATNWDAGVKVTGQGTSWTSVDWVLAVPRLNVVSGNAKYDLSGLSAQVQQRPTTIDLLGLTLPPATGAATTTTVASNVTSSRVTTGGPTTAPSGGSPFGLSFASSAHVTLPDASVKRPLSWKTSLNAGLTATYEGTPIPVTLALDADGDQGLYSLRKFALTAADANVNIDGQYDVSRPKPVSLHVALTQTPRLTPDAPIQGQFSGDFKVVGLLLDYDTIDDAIATAAAAVAATQPTTAPTTGPATLPTSGPASTMPAVMAAIATTTAPTTGPTTAPVHGKRWHPYLTTTGHLTTSELVVFGRPIGDMDVRLDGDVRTLHPPKTSNGPEAADALPQASQIHVALHSSDFALFQAPWNLTVEYPNRDQAAEVNLSTSNLPLDVLEKAAGMGQSPPISQGLLSSAHWKLVATGLGIGDIKLASEYHLTGINAAGLSVDTVDAAASFDNGVVTLAPVTAKSGTGVTHVSASYALARPTHVLANVEVVRWPYALTQALGGTTVAEASAKVDLDVDLAKKGATGEASAGVDVILHPTVGGATMAQTLAHAQLAATLRGQSADLTDLSGRLLNGTFKGAAQVDVGKPLEAAGRVEWRDVDAGALATITGSPVLKDLGGIFSGTVTIAPSRDPRSLEPVRIDVNVAARDGHYATVMLGDKRRLLMTHAVAYANLDRAVLDHSDIYVAGGILHLWGRIGRNLSSQTAIVDYNDISIDQLAHVIPKQADGPVPGLLAGEFRVTRNGSGLTSLIGGGHTSITACDLQNIPAVRKLYDLLQHGGDALDPTGEGGLDLAVEAGTVRINGLRFYGHGIEAKGIVALGPLDLTDVKASRLDGQVSGTLRDLKNSKISFFRDFDDLTSALMSGFSTVNIRGTLGAPAISQAGADDIGKGLQELIAGDAQAQQPSQ